MQRHKLQEKLNSGSIKEAFKNDQGAIDLASIMVGIIVIGIIGGVIAATVFAVIPWAQDNAAKATLKNVATAESAYRGFSAEKGVDAYANDVELRTGAFGNLFDATKFPGLTIDTTGQTTTTPYYKASVTSSTGNFFVSENGADPQKVSPVIVPAGEMKLTLAAGTACQTVQLPMSGNINTLINWGDGTPAATVTTAADATHTFSTTTAHDITINGTFDGWTNPTSSGTTGSKCVSAVNSWKDTKTTDLTYAFAASTRITNVAEIPATATNLTGMFMGSNYNGAGTSNWNTSNVTTLAKMFANSSQFNQSLNSWDTSNVTSLEWTFLNAPKFNQPLGNWNVGKVTTMSSTFSQALAFNQNLNTWDVSKVQNFSQSFYKTTSYNQPMDNWNTSSATDMSYMFNVSTNFNQNLSGWNVAGITTANAHANFGTSSALTAANTPKFAK